MNNNLKKHFVKFKEKPSTIQFGHSHYSSGIIEVPECVICGSLVESDICIRTIFTEESSDEELVD